MPNCDFSMWWRDNKRQMELEYFFSSKGNLKPIFAFNVNRKPCPSYYLPTRGDEISIVEPVKPALDAILAHTFQKDDSKPKAADPAGPEKSSKRAKRSQATGTKQPIDQLPTEKARTKKLQNLWNSAGDRQTLLNAREREVMDLALAGNTDTEILRAGLSHSRQTSQPLRDR